MAFVATWEEHGVYGVFSELVTLDEINEFNNGLYGDPRFDEISYQIVDFLNVSKLELQEADVAVPVATDWSTTSYIKNLKVALVADAPSIRVLCHSYIEQSLDMGSPWQFQVFHTLEEARVWVAD